MRHALTAAGLVVLLTACGGVGKVPFESDGAVLETSTPLETSPQMETSASPDKKGPTPDAPGSPEVCIPDCAGKECGDDGCGWTCGMCLPGVSCLADGTCEDCIPDCQGKWCGPDDCGSTCGECPPDQKCSSTGLCNFIDDPCEGKECGTWDGQWCGDCPCPGCPPSCGECNLETGHCEGCGPDDSNECPAIFDCLYECPESDQACQQNCVNSAVIEAQMAFNDLFQCWVDVDYWGCWDLCPYGVDYEDCPDEVYDCLAEKDALCEDAYYACYIPGDLTCDEIYDCFETCPNNENPCTQNCYQSGTIEAQKTAAAMWECYEEAGVFDCWDLCPQDAESMYDCPPEGQECLQAAMAECQDATNACFSPG